jgi:hypothetical protein
MLCDCSSAVGYVGPVLEQLCMMSDSVTFNSSLVGTFHMRISKFFFHRFLQLGPWLNIQH